MSTLGYHHTKESKEKIRLSNLGKHNFRHKKESLDKIGKASKRLWKKKWYRDKMLQAVAKPNSGHFKEGFVPWNRGLKLTDSKQKCRFSKTIRRKVKKDKCKWCGARENLQLDHIIAICNGGQNKIENCQVLCQKCNLLKRDTIDQVPLQLKKKCANSVKS